MKTLLAAAAAVSLLAIAAPASAGVYGSIGYGQLNTDDIDFDLVVGRLGWGGDDKWYGAEADLSIGLGDEIVGPGQKASVTSDIAVFAVAHFDIAESFTVFGRVGYGVLRIEQKPGVDFSADGLAAGVGAQLNIGEKDAVRLDYTYRDFTQDLDDEFNTWSISWVRKFR